MKKSPKNKVKKPSREEGLEKALLALRQAMNSALTDEARECGCSLSNFQVLKFVAEKGRPSMKDIARKLRVTPPSASSLVDTLVAKKLVARILAPEDRRSVRVILAPGGHKLLSDLHKHKSSIFRKMLSRLGARDRSEFTRILMKCVNV
ncbi:MAG TPA: MarR family transcriptional regulator [Candidatus Paceibacterota bacterium]|jgi:DNA-binding MarR family transcriptional regulator|nr:MarR family transcriptional regulator [Candidatus Paceibacterota bacterium]